MSGCGCSFTPVENKETEEIKYTDALAEQFAAEVGVDPRPNETLVEIDERGAFIRQPNAFIQPFGDKEGGLKAEANRFGIYWATGCNWSNRPIIVRELLGLQDVISETRVSPSGETNRYGHAFGQYLDFKDPATGAYFLSEFYKRANPDFKGRATTPTLVDVKEKKAVNNDYHRLTNYLEVQFRPFQPKDAPDLYPKKFRKEIDEFNDWLFPHVNNGHYRMAFCQSPEAYDEAYEDFYESLDKLDKRLEALRQELVKKQDIRDSLYRRYAAGEVSRADFYEFKRIFTRDCEEVERAIEAQQQELDRILESSTPDSPWIQHFKQFGQLETLNREVLVRLVERILVYEGGRIEIVFRYQEQFANAMLFASEEAAPLPLREVV